MDFGSIVGFLAILFISSLFNKAKNTANPPARPNRSPVPMRPTAKTSDANKNRRTTFTGSLEDLFSELKGEFEKNFGDTDKRQPEQYLQQDNTSENDSVLKQNPEKPSYRRLKDDTILDKSSVYAEEIGQEKISIEFDRKSIVQGIIMSEVLQKPKSLRR